MTFSCPLVVLRVVRGAGDYNLRLGVHAWRDMRARSVVGVKPSGMSDALPMNLGVWV